MNFLREVLDSTNELESPSNFYYWAALSAISAVVKDNIWMDRHIHNLYPNIYVMLHADSGLRKGPPISLAKDIVKRTGATRIISGRSSIQGILKQLGQGVTMPGGRLQFGGKAIAYIVSSELTSSLVEDKAAATILTDLYDRQYNEGSWSSLLKMEEFSLKDPTITMLTATNQAHSDDFFSQRDMQGGFYARTFVIFENKRHAVNSLMKAPVKVPDKDKLAAYLNELTLLKGPFKSFTNEDGSLTPAGDYYDKWYIDFCNTIDEQSIKDDTGTINRFGDSVLKVAMLISLSQSTDMEITLPHMMQAITKCEDLIGGIRKTTFGSKGKSVFAHQKTLVINELLSRPNHSITRTMLLRKYWMHGNSDEWDAIIVNFADAGLVQMDSSGGEIIYHMPADKVKELQDYLSGKNKKDL